MSSLPNEIKQIGHIFFVLFLVCTAIVIVGVVLEEIEWSRKPYADVETGIFSPERRRTLGKLGLWLLVIGISGEGLFEIARFWMDGLLQDVSHALLLNAEAQTGNAAKSAKTAHDEADAAKDASGIAKTEADQAIASAKTAIGQMNGISHKADDIDHRLNLALSLLAPRSVQHPEETKEKLRKLYKSGERIILKSYKYDIEGYDLCTHNSFS